MKREDAIEVLKGSKIEIGWWNKYIQEVPQPNLDGAHLACVSLTPGLHLDRLSLVGVDFSGAKIDGVYFQHADIQKASFENRATLLKCRFEGAIAMGARFGSANLTASHFDGANLAGASFASSTLNDTKFVAANLEGADLLGAVVNDGTTFQRARVKGCKINRYTLACLKDYGGLTVGDLMTMDIRDDVARLRMSFSGFVQWLHLAALVAFVFPYAIFLGRLWMRARFVPPNPDTEIPIWLALTRYIVNGGKDWELGWSLHPWAFAAFWAALMYNGARLLMLWKTKTLEMQQEASGLPAPFDLESTSVWKHIYEFTRYGLVVYLAAVLYHSFHFMTQRVPLH